MCAAGDFSPLIKEDGSPFSASEVAELTENLNALPLDAREAARNRNADEIAAHDGSRTLLVSGPGTGKSTLFKSRLKHWLAAHPDHSVAVATFVRKLVRDLNEDIAT